MNSLQNSNPFPSIATTSEEGATPVPYQRLLTLKTPEIQRAESVSQSYRESFGAPSGPNGRLLFLYGPPGSGKTHAIQYLRRQYTNINSEPGSLNYFDIYVKCDSPDFLALFRRIMVQIALPTMQELIRRFITFLSKQEFLKEIERTQGLAAKTSVETSTNIDFGFVQNLFDQYLLERRSVEEIQEREIMLTANGRGELNKVLSYLMDRNLGTVAHSWLTGDQISKDALDRLGVTSSIDSFDLSRAVLFVFFRLFGAASTPLYLYFDQAEKLLCDTEQRLVIKNVGLIHSLAEFIPREGGLLAVASTDDAWRALPPDLKHRFGVNQVSFPPLRRETAKRLVTIYLNSSRPVRSDEITPFSDDSIETLLLSSGGNVRRFLQHCAVTCDHAIENELHQIDRTTVIEALKKSQISVPIRPKVIDEIKKIAVGCGVPLRAGVKFHGRDVDFVAVGRGGRVRAIIQVSEAFFKDELDEVALASMDLAEQGRLGIEAVVVILVVVGYADPVVITRLSSVINHVLVFSPDSFQKDLAQALRDVPTGVLVEEEPDHQRILEKQIEELKRQLNAEVQEKRSQLAYANSEAAAALAKEAENRNRERWRTLKTEWAHEQKAIENEIMTRRTERSGEDLKAIEWERAKSQTALERKIRLQAAIFPTLMLFFGFALFSFTFRRMFTAFEFTILVILASAFSYFAGLFILRHLGNASYRILLDPVASLEELDSLAASLIRNRPVSHYNLRNPNPQIRYAAAKSLDHLSLDDRERRKTVLDMLRYETIRPIRRVLAEKLGAHLAERADYGASDILDGIQVLPEAPYIVETLCRLRYELVSPKILSPRTEVIPALYNIPSGYYRDLPARLAIAWRTESENPEVHAMVNAFEFGLTEVTWYQLYRKERPSTVSNAVDEVSPLKPNGLGECDQLDCIKDIDRIYLFFRQWLFFLENDFIPG